METEAGAGGDDGREDPGKIMKSRSPRGEHSQYLYIQHVDPYGVAFRAGLQPGDIIESINGHTIHDMIDLQFFGAGTELQFRIFRDDRVLDLKTTNPEMMPLGIVPEDMEYRCCGNHCVFCFIDQNPEGMRSALYVKDEDYRLSFLHGNYVTLTHTGPEDLERIVQQRLSPLYISIHAYNASVRKQMLGLKKEDRLLEKIRFLAEHDIEMHGQVVLCPGINDEEVLEETVHEFAFYHPQLKTLAVVPVGLTRHRGKLPPLKPVTSGLAEHVIRQIQPVQEAFIETMHHAFVYLADEFYLLAGQPLPDEIHYGEYWQIENGVGMTRAFLNRFHEEAGSFPESLKQELRMVIVTGTLAAPVLEQTVLPVLRKIRGLNAELLPVENRFYGSGVTVSGLLTGQDILSGLQKIQGDYHAVLPENCLNFDGIFLDDMTPEKLGDAIGRPVTFISEFGELWC